MTDTVCNYVGGLKLAHSLGWHGAAGFLDAPLEDLVINGAHSGKTKAYGGLTWIQAEGAGHMVPVDNPAAAFHAIGTLIQNGAVGCEDKVVLDENSFLRKSSDGHIPEVGGGLASNASAAASFAAGCLASVAGFLLLGGRALVAACR